MLSSKHTMLNVICPNCQTKDLGRIATNQYFCQYCCVELTTVNGQVTFIGQVEEDGSLLSLNDLFFDTESFESITSIA